MRRSVPRLALLLLAMVAMVLQAGSIPHLHTGSGSGFYNADHDLTLLAGLAGQGLPGDPPQAIIETPSAPVAPVVLEQPTARLAQAAESRAPPRC